MALIGLDGWLGNLDAEGRGHVRVMRERVCVYTNIRLTANEGRFPRPDRQGRRAVKGMSVEQMRKGDEKLTGHDICLLVVGCQQLQVERLGLGLGRGIPGRGGDGDQDMTALIVVEGKAQDVERGSHAEVVDNRDRRRVMYDREAVVDAKGQVRDPVKFKLAGYDVLRAWRLFDNESRLFKVANQIKGNPILSNLESDQEGK